MSTRTNRTLIKILILIPYLLVLYILQAMVFTHVTLLGVKPLLLPLAVAGLALFQGRVTGGIFGLFAGILMDLSYNQPAIEFTLVLTLTGILLGILSDTILAQGFPSFLVCCVLELLICSACQLLFTAVLDGVELMAMGLTALDQCVYSLIFTIPLYYVTRFLTRIVG